MAKKRIYGVLLIVLLPTLISCKWDADKGDEFYWATVDKRLIEKTLKEQVEKQNPYPKQYNDEINVLNRAIREKSRQIRGLESIEKQKCSKNKVGKNSIVKPLSRSDISTSSNNIEKRKFVASNKKEEAARKFNQDLEYKQCIAAIKDDQLINDLRVKLKKLQNTLSMQKQHNKKVVDIAKKIALEMIEKYAKDRFVVVFDKSQASVVYNAKGSVLDVTDAVVSLISESDIDMKIEGVAEKNINQ